MKSFLTLVQTLALACAVVALAPGQSGPQASQPAKLQVLIVTGQTRGTEWAASGKVTIPVPPELK